MANFKNQIENCFSFLTKYGFDINIYPNMEESLVAIFNCPSFGIRILQSGHSKDLHMELKTVKNTDKEKWIAFHWIVKYLSNNNEYETNFFRDEINYDIRIMYQIITLSEILKVYIRSIIDFFDLENYEKQYEILHTYIIKNLKERGLLK